MLQSVDVGRRSVSDYEGAAGREALERLRALAAPLRGARVLHLNATPCGDGVAEILRSEVPLLRDLGISADWKTITGDRDFFALAKTMRDAVQGAPRAPTEHERETYLAHSLRNAHLLEGGYDLVVAHDPQPLAVPHFHDRGSARWVWRCHVDASGPNAGLWPFLGPYFADYDAAVFAAKGFVPAGFPVGRVEIIPPAIDPEGPKNRELPAGIPERILGWLGVEVDKPLVTQVSRFDPWKDQEGAIEAFRLVRGEVPGLRLAIVGSMALDDPEGWEAYRRVREVAGGDPDIHVFTNLTGVGDVEVNAFQRLSEACIQRSVREGFGLVVSETLWKGTPMVAGRAGGIPMQMPAGTGGVLVESVGGCAEGLLHLLRHPGEGADLALRGRELVRKRFLIPRLICDELELCADLLGAGAVAR